MPTFKAFSDRALAQLADPLAAAKAHGSARPASPLREPSTAGNQEAPSSLRSAVAPRNQEAPSSLRSLGGSDAHFVDLRAIRGPGTGPLPAPNGAAQDATDDE